MPAAILLCSVSFGPSGLAEPRKVLFILDLCKGCVFLLGISMRIFLLAVIGLLLAACNQTAQNGASPTATSTAATSNEQLPPIYEPLIDMHRVNPDKYRRDLAECRQQAAPQEAAARAARQQQAAGTGLAVAGAVDIPPGPGARWCDGCCARRRCCHGGERRDDSGCGHGRLCAGREYLPYAQEISRASLSISSSPALAAVSACLAVERAAVAASVIAAAQRWYGWRS
jgi:hypothetical protein